MTSRIIRFRDCVPQPWKNGLGTTREIAVREAAENGSGFLWRVSVAEVDSAVPFSRFPGIDRHIVLLDGNGFDMRLDDAREHALTTPFEPFGFPGEASVQVSLKGGATRDFNLMVRRDFGSGTIRCVQGAGQYSIDADCVLLFAARGGICIGNERLDTGDSWCPDQCSVDPAAITLEEGAVALMTGIFRHQSSTLPTAPGCRESCNRRCGVGVK